MALSTIWVLLTQALIAWCFRLEVEAPKGSLHEDIALGRRHDAESGHAEAAGSALSASLQATKHESPEEARSGSNASSTHAKEPELVPVASVASESDATAADVANASAPDLAVVRQQVEYYLSDENLRYDKFFHHKICDDAEGWVEIEWILGCNKMKAMMATQEDVVAALKDSTLEVKDGGAFVRRPGNTLLPKLEPRPQYGTVSVFNDVPGEPNVSVGKDSYRPFIAGTQHFLSIAALRRRAKELLSTQSDGEHSVESADFDPNKFLERVYAVLNEQVALAIQAEEQLHTSKAPEVTKRIVKYIYNSAKREGLRSMRFDAACNELVQSAMGGYEATFSEKPWFFNLDLAPAFAAAAWEILRGQPSLRFEQVEAKTRAAFEEYLDSVMLNKCMWEASSKTFTNSAVHSKVYAAVQKAYRPAVDATIANKVPGQELDKAQDFMRRWIFDSMSRAWNSVPDSGRVLTVSSVKKLFQSLLAPFGPDDPFSTIPSEFTQQTGPPPRNWDFVNNEVEALFEAWRPGMNARTLGDFLLSVQKRRPDTNREPAQKTRPDTNREQPAPRTLGDFFTTVDKNKEQPAQKTLGDSLTVRPDQSGEQTTQGTLEEPL